MEVSVETREGLERRLLVHVPAVDVESRVDERLRSMARDVRLPGFRPGKVPFKLVRKRFGQRVRQDVLGDLIQTSYAEAVRQQSLRPAGQPEVALQSGGESGDLRFEATLEVMPEFEVEGTVGLVLERKVATVVDTDVDRVIADLRRQRAEFVEVDRAAGDDDRVTIDFTGTIDGEPFEGNEGEEQPVVIGSGTMPPEFEEALKGLAKGDEKAITYTFPETFPSEALKGRTALFQTRVMRVEERRLPDLDDELAVKVGVTEGGVEELRVRIRSNLEAQAERVSQEDLKGQVMDRLAEANSAVPVPSVMVRDQIQILRTEMQWRLQQQTGGEPVGFDLPDALFEDRATRLARLGLCVDRLVGQRGLKPEPERMMARLRNMVGTGPDSSERMQEALNDERTVRSIQYAALEDQLIDTLIEEAAITAQELSLDELMRPTTAQAEDESAGDTGDTGTAPDAGNSADEQDRDQDGESARS